MRLECLTPRSSRRSARRVIRAQSTWLPPSRSTARCRPAFSRGSGSFIDPLRTSRLLGAPRSRYRLACRLTLEKIVHCGRRLAASNSCREASDSGLDRRLKWHVLPRTDQLFLQANCRWRTRHQLVQPPRDRIIQLAAAHQLIDQSPRIRLLCRKISPNRRIWRVRPHPISIGRRAA